MTTLDHLLGFESALMDWMFCVPPQVLSADEPGRALLHARQRLYDTINDIVADAKVMGRLERVAEAEMGALVDQLRRVPQEHAALPETYRLVRQFLATVCQPAVGVSGEHVIGRRTSAA